MKFKTQRSRFIEALKSVQNVVAGKGALPVLQNVLIEAAGGEVKMTTTDLDISIMTKVECDVGEEGVTTLPVRLLFNSFSTAPDGDVEVEVDAADKATIRAGKACYRLTGLPEKEFPKLPKDEGSCEYKIPQDMLKEMLRKTSYAASQDDTRRTLKGVLMSFKDSKLTMVATDGRRLAMTESEVEFPQNAEKDIVLPYKAVVELQRSLEANGDVIVKVEKSQICFKLKNQVIYSKLIDDVYPNYQQVIPKSVREKIKVDRQQLLDAIGRASVMTLDEAHSIKFVFEGNRLLVTSASNDVGESKDEVEIKYVGENIEIMFNPNYVIDPLKAMDEDEICIELNDGHSPAIIRSEKPFIYVLMPLRIS